MLGGRVLLTSTPCIVCVCACASSNARCWGDGTEASCAHLCIARVNQAAQQIFFPVALHEVARIGELQQLLNVGDVMNAASRVVEVPRRRHH